MVAQPGMLTVFRHRNYRDLWLGAVLSNIGAMVQLVGASWLMTSLSDSPSMVALVQTSVSLPLMLASVLAGVLADSYDRRKVLLVAQTFMFVVSVVLTVVAVMGLLNAWTLLTFTLLIGFGTALHNPSWQASFSDLVPKEDLPTAVAANAMGMNVTRSVGPAAGGAIVALAGAPAAFAVNAVTYVAIIGALLKWRPNYAAKTLPREKYFSALAVGLRYFLLSPNLLRINSRGFLFSFNAIAAQALLPLVAKVRLEADAFVFGILLGAFGAGAVVGALVGVRVRSNFQTEQIVRFGFLSLAIVCVILAISGSAILSALAVAVAGASWINVLSTLNATVQLSSPRWVIGRTISLFMTFIFGGMALGSWVWGEVTEAYSLETAYLTCASLLLIGAVIGRWMPVPQAGANDLDPVNRFREPVINLDISRRSGPIGIQVEFDILQEDVPAFLSLMAERRTIHVRDGARQWSIMRDLEDPRRWVESYRFPTWTEYVRHNERRTKSDDENSTRLFALHQGGERPKITRFIERHIVDSSVDDTLPIRSSPEHMH